MTWSFYDKSTGEFSGVGYSGPEIYLEGAIPPGHLPFPGKHDRDFYRVSQADDGYGNLTPCLQKKLPPRPEDTEKSTWAWSEADNRWEETPTLEGAKSALWEKVKVERALAEVAPITAGGRTFDADSYSTTKILGAFVKVMFAQSQGYPVADEEWTLADNTRVLLTAGEVLTLGMALGNRTSDIHQTSRDARDRIFACTSTDQVATISWSFPP